MGRTSPTQQVAVSFHFARTVWLVFVSKEGEGHTAGSAKRARCLARKCREVYAGDSRRVHSPALIVGTRKVRLRAYIRMAGHGGATRQLMRRIAMHRPRCPPA